MQAQCLQAMQAQCLHSDWQLTAFSIQALALAKLNTDSNAVDMLNEAAELEEKRQVNRG